MQVLIKRYRSSLLVSLIFLLGGVLSTTSLQAQYFEVGAGFGAALYRGDLSQSSVESIGRDLGLSGTIQGSYHIRPRLGIALYGAYGTVYGSDEGAETAWKERRNLSFRSRIISFGARVDYYLFGYDPLNYKKPFSPYLFAGGGMFHFNPEAKYRNRWVELQPLGTEGQGHPDYPDREKYDLWAVEIPFGVGMKYAITETISIFAEVGLKYTTTDYIDDVSTTYIPTDVQQSGPNGDLAEALANRTPEMTGEPYIITTEQIRGNPNNNDWYGMGLIGISYTFIDNGLGGSRRRHRSSGEGCPSF